VAYISHLKRIGYGPSETISMSSTNQTDGKDEKYWVDYDVYNVAERIDNIDDDDWYEYKVMLMQGEELLTMWDSRTETYNGSEKQRLTYKTAKDVVLRIKEQVEESQDPSNWFPDY